MKRAGLLAIALLGCGEGVSASPATECDPIADQGCPGGQHCRAGVDGQTFCLAPQAAEGAVCVTGSCPAAEVCLRVEGRLACHPLCDPAGAACTNGGECAYRLGAADAGVGVCETPCAADATCGPGGTCGFGAELTRRVCVGVGAVEAGGDCSAARCAAGLLCLSRQGETRCEVACARADPIACAGAACDGLIEGFADLGYCRRGDP